MVKPIEEIIEDVLEHISNEEDSYLIREFDEMYRNLEESHKSNLVRILIGYGAIKKENGKLIKNRREGNKIKKKLGITKKKK